MSSKNRFLSGITLAVAVGAFATFASAQETTTTTPQEGVTKQETRERGYGKHGGFDKGMHGGKHGSGMMRGLRGIELTDAQKEQIRAIREANRPDDTNKEEIRTLMEAKRAGTLTADQQEKLRAFKQQRREKAEAVQAQVLAILTPEQLQQMEQKKQEMKQRWEQRRQMRDQTAPQTPEKPIDN
jgi:periplasmic protein CpxP/Spy